MAITMEDVLAILGDKTVQFYLATLAVAVWKCTSVYHKTRTLSSQSDNHTLFRGYGYKYIPPFLSITIIGITWFYIFRFILTHQSTSESYFDDAYKDVLREHYFTSTQLLTWAIVSVIWVSSEGNSGIPFLLFGFLGAMGASFVLWIPSRFMNKKMQNNKSRGFVPFVYVVTSITAFYCILQIRPCQIANDGEVCLDDQGFGSFAISFRAYLHGLHYLLLLPIGLTICIPSRKQPQVDSTLFYGIMGMVITTWHIFQLLNGTSSLYRSLETDCQKSIHIDLLCCSILTLYAIFHGAHGGSGYGNGINIRSTRNTSVGALLMPIISPAAVLSFHLCLENLPGTHQSIVGKMQHMIAHHRRKHSNTSIKINDSNDSRNHSFSVKKETDSNNDARNGFGWCNLGLWKKNYAGNCSYDEACENLALSLAREADLKKGDGVLSCGCGVAGNELELYYSRFNLAHITGVDPCVSMDSLSVFDLQNVQRIQASVDDLVSRNGKLPFFRPHLFNKIVALDNIYHYPEKMNFFQYCMKILPNGGKVAVTDIIWMDDHASSPPIWVKLALYTMGVKPLSIWTEYEYTCHLESLGFSDISVKRIGSEVFGGWRHLLPSSLIKYLDYSIIVASKGKESQDQSRVRKKRVAVIGSGMAGLVAAHTISCSSMDIEVKIFEAANKPGLAGNTMKVGNQLVDVPARMAALGYYKEYMELVKKLRITYQVVKTDCTFHGQDGAGGYVKHIYEQFALSNLYHAIFVGGLKHLWKMARTFSSIPFFLVNSKRNGLSFGDWLHDHLNIYPPSSPNIDNPTKHQGWQFSYFVQHENAFLYMIVGSFSWMLSCTYHQLIACPADILLPYIDGLGLTTFLGVFKEGSTVRIQPSIKALEHALLYGIEFEGNTKVCNLDEKKNINGVDYDAVICATEASAVPCVVYNCSKVFGKFHYHPSTIYLHNDSSMLPKRRSDWRTWEVRMEPEHEEAQLTFWLNRYYENINFDGDVFETWAPIKPPKPECILKKFDMSRVVHTSASKDMVQIVQKEQGKGGFYYAGSYAVYGMGLLEEATISGRLAAEHALQDLFHKTN